MLTTSHSSDGVAYCHQAPGRAVATGREVCESGREYETTPLSSAVSPVYSTRSNMHFNATESQRSFVHSTTVSLLSRVLAAFAPRGSESAQTRRPSALSYREELRETLTRNTKEKQNQNVNATHYTRRLIYCLVRVRQRKGRFPGQMLNTIP